MNIKVESAEFGDDDPPSHNYCHYRLRLPEAMQRQSKTRHRYRPRVQYRWTTKDILKLIATVEMHCQLWDKTSPEYKQPSASAWQDVSDVLVHVTPDECKAKWTNLRVGFNINLAKYRSLCQKGIDPETGKKAIQWKYFIPMLFLENVVSLDTTTFMQQQQQHQPTITDSNSSSMSMAFVDISELNEDSSEYSHQIAEDSSEYHHPVAEDLPHHASPEPHGSRYRARRSSTPPSSSPSPTPDSSAFADRTLQPPPPHPSRPPQSSQHHHLMYGVGGQHDHLSAFGDFVVSELRSIPPDRAAYVKRKLNRTLMDLMDEVDMMPVDCFKQEKRAKTSDCGSES